MRPVRPKKTPGKSKSSSSKEKDPIEVFCRIRPLDDEAEEVCFKAKDENTVVLIPPDGSQTGKIVKEVHYSFKHVFDENTTQKQLFDHACLPLVQDLLQGHNGLLFTYGVTSSGKTHTMTGTPQDGGLLPRTLDVIFNSIQDIQAKKFIFKPDKMNGFEVQSSAEAFIDQQKEMEMINKNKTRNKKEVIGDWCSRVPDTTVVEDLNPDINCSVFVSYVEIYNNYIYDLLDDTPIDLKKTKSLNSKLLREDAAHNMYVFGVTENEVKSVEEALELFYKGQTRRKVSHTALNTESSRSHIVFTIRLVQAPLDAQGAEILQSKGNMIVSQLSLVDLAGSERTCRTKTTGSKLKEAGNINSSLMLLRNCIEILRDSQKQGVTKMVPYRETKLTHLFKTFFEGEGKIRMVVCVNPRADYHDETVHVMRFAEMTQDVLISRATPVSTPHASGLRHGRGNLFREAKRKAKEQGIPVAELLAPTVYSLGPVFPPLILESSEDESFYINLIEILTTRLVRKGTFNQDVLRRQEEFRKNVIVVEKENIQFHQERTLLQMDLDAREQQVRILEQKLAAEEENIDAIQREKEQYKRKAEIAEVKAEDIKRKFIEQVKETERIKLQAATEKQEAVASERNRNKRKMDKKCAELERKLCLSNEKIKQFREILEYDDDDDRDCLGDNNIPGHTIPSTTTFESSNPVTRSKKNLPEFGKPSVQTHFPKARSATDVAHGSHNTHGSNVHFADSSSKTDGDTVFYKENRPPNSSQGTRGIVVANPRHRRSTSTGDVWIEHKPIGNLDLNTVLQPAIKKKKSVSKLEVKDVTNSEKYLLQHQEQDSQGEVETQLYKADIIPSAGGGAQVIFNDVEKLRQVSPPPVYNLRKRSGDSMPLREVEDRCAVSVECHGLPSKILKKK